VNLARRVHALAGVDIPVRAAGRSDHGRAGKNSLRPGYSATTNDPGSALGLANCTPSFTRDSRAWRFLVSNTCKLLDKKHSCSIIDIANI
jgi:hypothetical protein